jgi:hypothetical protein
MPRNPGDDHLASVLQLDISTDAGQERPADEKAASPDDTG